MKVRVRAKLDAGWHPVHGAIVAGAIYEIEDHQFADQLFEPIINDNQTPVETGKTKGK